MTKTEDYLALPYTMMVRWSADDELFVARIKEIEECVGHGESPADALSMLRDNLEAFVEFSLERGDAIPMPQGNDALPSGKWLQRVPRTLHRRIIECAADEGVSLNTYVTSCLATAVGRAERKGAVTTPGILEDLHAGLYAAMSPVHTQHGRSLPSYCGVIGMGSVPLLSTQSYMAAALPHAGFESLFGRGPVLYSAFVHSVARQVPSHFDAHERIGCDEEEKQSLAYAR
jgi:predicted RNase H-like HicB family nuclease